MAVDPVRGVVVVSGEGAASRADENKLHVYSLSDGRLLRSFGGKGSGKGQFDWAAGGLCMTPRGTLLVAERVNNRLQEVDVDDGSWVRFVGVGVLRKPNFVDCSESVIATSESAECSVALLSWGDGSFLRRFGGGDGPLKVPLGLRLLPRGDGVVVTSRDSDQLSVFSLAGAFVRSVPVGASAFDVEVCDSGFVVAHWSSETLSKVTAVGTRPAAVSWGAPGLADGEFHFPAAIALVRRGGGDSGGSGEHELVVLEVTNKRFQVLRC